MPNTIITFLQTSKRRRLYICLYIFFNVFINNWRRVGLILINLFLFWRACASGSPRVCKIGIGPVPAEYCNSYFHSYFENSTIDCNYCITKVMFVSLTFVILKLWCKTIWSSSVLKNIHGPSAPLCVNQETKSIWCLSVPSIQ